MLIPGKNNESSCVSLQLFLIINEGTGKMLLLAVRRDKTLGLTALYRTNFNILLFLCLFPKGGGGIGLKMAFQISVVSLTDSVSFIAKTSTNFIC